MVSVSLGEKGGTWPISVPRYQQEEAAEAAAAPHAALGSPLPSLSHEPASPRVGTEAQSSSVALIDG